MKNVLKLCHPMRYLYFISQEESLLEMSVEKMVDIYLTETPDKLRNAEELQNHYQIGSSVIRFSKSTSSSTAQEMK